MTGYLLYRDPRYALALLAGGWTGRDRKLTWKLLFCGQVSQTGLTGWWGDRKRQEEHMQLAVGWARSDRTYIWN